jgi:hypothetical protein
MYDFEKKLLNPNDWLAKHPKVIAFLMVCCILLVSCIK